MKSVITRDVNMPPGSGKILIDNLPDAEAKKIAKMLKKHGRKDRVYVHAECSFP